MNISGSLDTFASGLSFYIDEFERIMLHISSNLPVISNQIDGHVTEARQFIKESSNGGEPAKLLDHMSEVRLPIYEIVLELQKQDIINQQMDHLLTAVDDVRRIIDEDSDLFSDYANRKKLETSKSDYQHLFTLIAFILERIDSQMTRINVQLAELIGSMEERFVKLHKEIEEIQSLRQGIFQNNGKLDTNILSLLIISDTLSGELNQYSNFFERLRLLQEDMEGEVAICSGLKREIHEEEPIFGGLLPLDKCRFSNLIIQGIVDKMTVEEERDLLRKKYNELDIEESAGSDIILF